MVGDNLRSSDYKWRMYIMLEPKEAYTYKGATVLEPKKGIYHNLIVVDVISLYPSMAILNNISFDTVNCECCKDDQDARIRCEIGKMFNSDSDSDGRESKNYWICKRIEGIFPKKLSLFKDERIRQKQLGNTVKQLALKILINGGYGVFGNRFFKYYDPRVAELIPAYGRYTLTKMQEIAKEMGLNVVYGDTDSLFIDIRINNYEECNNENAGSRTVTQLNSNNNIIAEQVLKFKEECNRRLGIEVEHSKTYKTAIISGRKKHYIGWIGIPGTAPDIVGMEGDKNDRPKWINNVFRQVVEAILGINESNSDPISVLEKAILLYTYLYFLNR